MTPQTNKPICTFVNGAMHSSVFRDDSGEDGKPRGGLSVTLNKRYFDRGASEWRTSRSLFPADLPNAIRALQRALEYVETQQAGDDAR